MNAIPRFRPFGGPALFSAGFRPFFLGGAVWAAIAIPLWLAIYGGEVVVPSALPPAIWHVHEMVYGYGAAIVAGFLLTAIPNWTGRMPLQGWSLIVLFAAWVVGRVAVLISTDIGATAAAVFDLAFPIIFTTAIAREIIAGRNWHNLAVVIGLSLLGVGNLLVHLEALGIASTADLGNRMGVAILLLLISLIGGRIVPSFTTNWLKKNSLQTHAPAPRGSLDNIALVIIVVGLLRWTFVPEGAITSWLALAAGIAVALRLSRWRGSKTAREPLLLVLHMGYGWLAFGLMLLGFNGLHQILPASAALHALTVGAVGTMTLAVMTRASLGHTGQPLTAGVGTTLIYALVTIAAVLRVLSPLAADNANIVLSVAGAAWSAAFGLFVLLYGRLLAQPRP